MDRITRLQVFKLAAETLNFTRTAAAMGLARSSVTKAVNDLEVELGTRLLDRTTRAVSLTPEGKAFLARSREVIELYEDSHTMFGNGNKPPGGRVRASVPSRIGRRIIAPALPEFLETYPEIDLELRVSHQQDDLVKQGLDFVLLIANKGDSEFIARHLADARLIVAATPAYLERYGVPRSVEDLKGRVGVGYHPPRPWQFWRFPGVPYGPDGPLPLRSVVTATNADMYIACGKAGLGLMHVPIFEIRDELARGDLVQVLPDVPTGSVAVAVVYAHRRNLSPRVRVVVDWISNLVRATIGNDSPVPGPVVRR